MLLLAVCSTATATAQNHAAAPPRRAQPDAARAQAQARAYYVSGNRNANAGRWDDAYAEYSIAWQLFPEWQTAGAFGRAALKTKHHAMGVLRLSYYLSAAPPGRLSPKERAEVEALVAGARPRVGSLSIVAPAGAEVHIDGDVVGTAPLPGPVPADPGKHQVEVHTRSGVQAQAATVVAGKVQQLSFVSAQAASADGLGAQPAAAAGSGSTGRAIGLAGGAAVTVAGAVVGGVFLSMAGEHGSKKQEAALDRDGRDAMKTSAQAEAEAKNTALWGFVGAGLAAAGTTVFYLTTRSSAKTTVTGAAGVRNGCPSIWLQGQF